MWHIQHVLNPSRSFSAIQDTGSKEKPLQYQFEHHNWHQIQSNSDCNHTVLELLLEFSELVVGTTTLRKPRHTYTQIYMPPRQTPLSLRVKTGVSKGNRVVTWVATICTYLRFGSWLFWRDTIPKIMFWSLALYALQMQEMWRNRRKKGPGQIFSPKTQNISLQ